MGVLQPSGMTAACVTSHLQVRGQGLVMYGSEISGKSGSRLLFVHLATREETGDRIPVTDERREWRWKEGLSAAPIDLSVFSQGERVCWPLSHQKCWGIGCMARWKCWQSECTYQGPTQIWGQFWETVVGVTGSNKGWKRKTKEKKKTTQQTDYESVIRAARQVQVCWCCPLVDTIEYRGKSHIKWKWLLFCKPLYCMNYTTWDL